MEFIESSDLFFESQVLRHDNLTVQILSDIDSATFLNQRLFTGRTKGAGYLPISCLSTGAKTVLSVLYNPDKCFSLDECGENAIRELFLVTEGHVLWQRPCIYGGRDKPCDLVFKGRQFKTVQSFREYLREEYNGC